MNEFTVDADFSSVVEFAVDVKFSLVAEFCVAVKFSLVVESYMDCQVHVCAKLSKFQHCFGSSLTELSMSSSSLGRPCLFNFVMCVC